MSPYAFEEIEHEGGGMEWGCSQSHGFCPNILLGLGPGAGLYFQAGLRPTNKTKGVGKNLLLTIYVYQIELNFDPSLIPLTLLAVGKSSVGYRSSLGKTNLVYGSRSCIITCTNLVASA